MKTVITDKNIRTLVNTYIEHGVLPIDLSGVPIGDWDVSNVTNMSFLFSKTFNEPLNNWNVSKVENMYSMFEGATSFNQPLNNWNVSKVNNMTNMFKGATSFNQPLNEWNVSNVKYMYSMFYGATSFNQPLNNWDTSNVKSMQSMFYGATSFNQPLNNWDTSNVDNMDSMFRQATSFNQPLNKWNVSKVNNMGYMFEGATSFNQPLNNWDTSNVDNMDSMFREAKSFNQPLNNWDTSNVKYMKSMFEQATSFNQPLNDWNVSNVESMDFMFEGATTFNQPLNAWNVSNVKSMQSMFKGATSFNQPLNDWNVINVKSMYSMFEGATSFNQPLNAWNVSNVQSMDSMFEGATSFNQLLNAWNVSNVQSMDSMFEGATSFNQLLNAWNISNVKSMDSMFEGATSLNQALKVSNPMLDKFNELMEPFKNNPNTILNTKQYINDSILYNQHNPYLVHYETFGGISYPIISILKGTVLFTARTNKSESLNKSYFHLYKLHGNPTINEYVSNDFANTFTYFFPTPFMADVIKPYFKTMDMVVLSKDVRLLCLITPSPIERGIKDNTVKKTVINPNDKKQYYNDDSMKSCKDRNYDICLSKDLIYGLKLNGYIAIAHMDSFAVSQNISKVWPFHMGNFTSSLLYLSSCFNNAIYQKRPPLGSRFIDKMVAKRTYGIPEIVLIPYDIHTNSDPATYKSIYSIFDKIPMSDTVNSHFIFKYVAHVDGDETTSIMENPSIIVCKKMGNLLRDFAPRLSKSLQCFPLLNVLKDKIDHRKMDYIVDYERRDTIPFEDIAFTHSYLPGSTSKCAFETVYFYEKFPENSIVGGKGDIPPIPPAMTIEPLPIVPTMTKRAMINKPIKNETMLVPMTNNKQNIIKTNTNPDLESNIEFVSDNIYYSEVHGIPIFAYIHDKDVVPDDKNVVPPSEGGKIKKTRKRRAKRMSKTKKRNTYACRKR